MWHGLAWFVVVCCCLFFQTCAFSAHFWKNQTTRNNSQPCKHNRFSVSLQKDAFQGRLLWHILWPSLLLAFFSKNVHFCTFLKNKSTTNNAKPCHRGGATPHLKKKDAFFNDEGCDPHVACDNGLLVDWLVGQCQTMPHGVSHPMVFSLCIFFCFYDSSGEGRD